MREVEMRRLLVVRDVVGFRRVSREEEATERRLEVNFVNSEVNSEEEGGEKEEEDKWEERSVGRWLWKVNIGRCCR